jgi:hypothetical protein
MTSKIASVKTNGKKLSLAKETLRSLTGSELEQVAGGSFGNQVFTAGCPEPGQSVLVACGIPGLNGGGLASSVLARACGSFSVTKLDTVADRGF